MSPLKTVICLLVYFASGYLLRYAQEFITPILKGENYMKVTVMIREELEKEIQIEVEDGLNIEEARKKAKAQAIGMYGREEVVLDADDYARTFFYADVPINDDDMDYDDNPEEIY